MKGFAKIGCLAHSLLRLAYPLGLASFGQCAQLSYVSALPTECRNGCSLQMISPNLSWLKGSVQLWETLDGGRSWKVKPLPRLAVPWDYADIQFADHRRGWLLMNALQELYETSDGAVTWEPKSLPLFDGQVWTAWLPPMTNFAWVGGGIYNPSASPTAPNYALKKYDSGGWGIMRPSIFVQKTVGRGTWKAHELPSCSYMVTQLRFWNEEAGFAVGDGCFYYTEDGGDGETGCIPDEIGYANALSR